jgi:uncharacterized protein (TIGR00369 family)
MKADNPGLDFWAIVDGRAPPPPSARLLSWRFVRLDEAGVLHCAFVAKEAFLNPAGYVQGGLLAAMLDEAMGPVVAATTREAVLAQTLEMKTSYLRGARPGTILGEGRVLHRGREVVFLEGRLLDPDGNIIAAATATARLTSSFPA